MSSRRQAWMAPFFTIWTGQAFSLIGSGLVQFALVWWLTLRTGSATVLATATLAATLPGILLGPFAGACVDRWNRRLVMMVSDGIVAVASAALALLALGGHLDVWHVYVAMTLRSAAGCFHWPAMQASTSLMVPPDQLTRVSGVNQTLDGALAVASPPLGALLVAVLPLHGVLAIDVLTAALAILPLFLIVIPQPPRAAPSAPATSLLADVRAGLAYVWRWPAIMGIIGMAMLLNLLFRPAFSLLPLLIMRHMGSEAMQLGAVNSAFGLGAVAGGLLLGIWGGFRRSVLTSITGVFGMGIGMLVIGFAPDHALWVVVAGMLLAGLAQPLADGPLFALLQRTVAPEMQGRVFTVLIAGCSAAAPLGLALAGPVADAVGIRPLYVAAGVMTAIVGAWGLRFRPLWELDDGPLTGESPDAPPSGALATEEIVAE